MVAWRSPQLHHREATGYAHGQERQEVGAAMPAGPSASPAPHRSCI